MTAAQHNEIKTFIMGLDLSGVPDDPDAFWDKLFEQFPAASEDEIAAALKDAADTKRSNGEFYIGLANAADLVADYLDAIPEGVDRAAYINSRVKAGDPKAIEVANAMFLLEGNMGPEAGQ